MATRPLVHLWDSSPVPPQSGLFPLGNSLPAVWAIETLDPEAFPTPFGRAEALRLQQASAEESKGKALFRHFQLLLLGVASGALRVEPANLASGDYDNLGQALLQVDPQAQYFCRLTLASTGLLYGVSYPSCLVWSHARRTDGDWDALSRAIGNKTEALQVLADWRKVLQDAGRWRREVVVWQRAVDVVLEQGGAQPSADLRSFHRDCRLVGPIRCELPIGDANGTVRPELLYLPTSAPGFSDSFVRLSRLPAEVQDQSLLFRTASGKTAGAIRVLPMSKNTDEVALGTGLVEGLDERALAEVSATQMLQADALRDLLQPVAQALGEINRTVDRASVLACPALYPDAIRLWAQRLARPAHQPTLTRRAELLLVESASASPSDAEVQLGGGLKVRLEGSQRQVDLLLLERLGEIEVLDLRALGAVLWQVFVGEGTLGQGHLLGPSGQPLLIPGALLEPPASIYEQVAQPPGALRSRLATLQRLVAAYPDGAGALERVLAAAARSFARWASDRPDIAALGRTGGPTVSVGLPIGLSLPLAVDAHAARRA